MTLGQAQRSAGGVPAVAGHAADLAALGDRELVERARTDPDAFALLYRRHVAAIHAFVWRRCGSREVAEDVTATTFERALHGLPRFTWQRGGFVAWLHRIAAHALIDHHRAAAREEGERGRAALQRLLAEDDGEELDRIERAGELPALRAALDTLSPRHQQAVALRYLSDLPAADAAAAMGCSRAVLAVTLHRALLALRRELAPAEEPRA